VKNAFKIDPFVVIFSSPDYYLPAFGPDMMHHEPPDFLRARFNQAVT
jgi:hypothetical protein